MHSISSFEEATRGRLADLTAFFLAQGADDHASAARQAVALIATTVRQQAYVMAFSDAFFVLGGVLLVALSAALLLKRPNTLTAGATH